MRGVPFITAGFDNLLMLKDVQFSYGKQMKDNLKSLRLVLNRRKDFSKYPMLM